MRINQAKKGNDHFFWGKAMGKIAYGIATVLFILGTLQNACAIGGVDQEGPFKVGLFSYDAVDTARGDRTLFTQVWYPIDPGTPTPTPLQYTLRYSPSDVWEYPSPFIGGYEEAPVSTAATFPLVIFSHGSAANSYFYSYVGESLASHGYVVAAPNHTGNTWEEYRFWPDQWTHLTIENTRLRLQDVSFVIDEMQRMDAAPSSMLFGAINLDQIGVAGHSYGANTSLVMPVGFQEIPADERVKAIASVDGGWQVQESLLMQVSVPTLLVGRSEASSDVDPWLSSVPERGRVDVLGGADHRSFLLGECQCLPILFDQGAPQEVIDFVEAGWLPTLPNPACEPSAMDINEVQRITNESIVSFFDRTLKLDNAAGLISPAEAVEATVRVERTSTSNPGHPLQVFIEDPIGRRIGFDPTSGVFVNDFGTDATFDDMGGEDLHLFTLPPMSGEYLISGVGVAENGYKIESRVVAAPTSTNVSEHRVLAEDMATVGGLLEPQLLSLVNGVSGDYDFDSDVDGADFLAWQRGESPDPHSAAELTAWEASYGTLGTLSAAWFGVPEPRTLLLAIFAICSAFACMRHS